MSDHTCTNCGGGVRTVADPKRRCADCGQWEHLEKGQCPYCHDDLRQRTCFCCGRTIQAFPKNGEETQETVWAWVIETFGTPTPDRAIDRLYEELMELKHEVEWAEHASPDYEKLLGEFADVVICGYSVFAALGKDMQAAVDAKMAVNRARKWCAHGDGTGHHVEPILLEGDLMAKAVDAVENILRITAPPSYSVSASELSEGAEARRSAPITFEVTGLPWTDEEDGS